MTEHGPRGRIITFYSYKGGTGRTMLLANIAWILASAGKRVLAIDWDLEAPGLHRYFHPFLIDPELEDTDGLMDIVLDYASEAVTPLDEPNGANWLDRTADVKRYAVSVNWSFPQSGQLHLLSAGRQNASYSIRVNTFDWRDFYERLKGGAFFELVKEQVKRDYDYILIDSRTGVSDTSGICTVQMPDRLVVCFTASEQNIRGSASISASVRAQWARLDAMADNSAARTGGNARRIFPIFTRIEHTEKRKLDAARAHVRALFRPILQLGPAEDESYWNRVEVTYWPYYAFEEVLAVFGDEFRTDTSLLVACETVVDLLSDGQVKQFKLPSSVDRKKVLRAFARRAFDETSPDAHESLIQDEKLLEEVSRLDRARGTVFFRVFFSSPGDVADERALARRLLKHELPYDPMLRGRVNVDLVSWYEDAPMLSGLTPQEAVNRFGYRPSECDIVIVVLWSRLGTHLKIEGTPYLSGTEYEYEEAVNAERPPQILVYRRTERFPIYADDPNFDEKLEQYRKAQAFFDRFKRHDGSYRGGFTDYTTPTEFVSRLEKDLKTILWKRLESVPSPPPAGEPVWTGSPYPGLRPFDITDEAIFFGRGRETDALIARLRDPHQRFLAVVGASGSGKSSLVRAGLLPRLQQGAIEGSRHWRVLTLTPGAAGGNPFLALAFELARELPPSTRKPAIKIAEQLAEEPQRIAEYAAALLAGSSGDGTLVIFVDQMEELFVANPHQAAFLDLLAHAAGDSWLRVLATLRADFLSQAVAEPTLRPLLQAPAGTYLLAPPDPLALAEMIRRPAERAGLDIEDDMVREVLKDAGTDPGALPLVAFCLEELYRSSAPAYQLTAAAYDDLGRLRGAIGRHAEALLSDLQKTEGVALDALLSTLFSVLVHVDAAGTVTRRRAIPDELITELSQQRLIEVLITGRLLQAESTGGRATITVAHEALLTAWPALHKWVEAHRAQLQRFQRLLLSLASDNLLDRRYAVAALSDMVTVMPEAVPVLRTALADADATVRQAAADALGKVGPDSHSRS